MAPSEVIVIGAGPAGATAARLLARAGIGVILTDRAAFPRGKLCGGCLAQPGFDLLGVHALAELPSLASAPVIDRLELRSAHRRMSLPVRPYRVIDRAAFDQDLVHAATVAGARFMPGTLARVNPDRSIGLTHPGRGVQTLTPRIIIVADGIKGAALRDAPGFSWGVDPRARVGMGGIISALPRGCAPDAITMLHGPQGYAGIAPLRLGRAVIAAAVDPRWVGRPHDSPPLIALLNDLGLDIDPGASLAVTGGAPGLTRTRESIEADGRIFLIGDATGYIEPFTGEGMAWAIQDACMVAGHARAALAGRYIRGVWTAQHRRANRRRKALCRVSTRLLRHPKATGAIILASSSLPALGGCLARVVRALQRPQTPESSHA